MSKTLVTFVLDRSGSMSLNLEATKEAFNAYVSSMKKDLEDNGGPGIDFTLVQFDSYGNYGHPDIEKIWFEKPIAEVPLLDSSNYVPRGGTPLIDAAFTTIMALEESIAKKTEKPKVVVCIQTDGQENSSREHTWEQLKALIARKTEEGWQFNFMGAGIDAYDQSEKMGLTRGQTVSYNSNDLRATRAVFEASATNTSEFRRGTVSAVMYTAAQKQSAGDVYDDPNLVTTGGPAVPKDIPTSKKEIKQNERFTL